MKFKCLFMLLLFIVSATSCKNDRHAPVIQLLGKNPAETGKGYPYTDAGATASDEEDGDITDKIVITSNVDTGQVGSYQVQFNVTDSDGDKAEEVVREVIVKYFK